MSKIPPFVSADAEQVANELGEAMMLPQFSRILDLLEEYEVLVLRTGIDDPNMTKDFIAGAVHANRTLRQTLRSALEFHYMKQQKEEDAVRRRSFSPPGSGPGGLS